VLVINARIEPANEQLLVYFATIYKSRKIRFRIETDFKFTIFLAEAPFIWLGIVNPHLGNTLMVLCGSITQTDWYADDYHNAHQNSNGR
jgi:hypothetical protein